MPLFSDQLKMTILPKKTFPYHQALGALMFVANFTCPDISFAVHFLARSQLAPEPLHWTLVQRILYYLSNTLDLGLECPAFMNETLTNMSCPPSLIDAFVDADHAADRTRKSTTGFIIRFAGTPVMWCSRLQQCIAEHTAEAEYVALNEAAHDVLFLSYLTNETLKIPIFPVTLYEDNYAALRQACTKVGKGRLKHVELRYFKIKEHVERHLLKIE